MASFTINVPLLRLAVALCIFSTGLYTLNTLNHPKTLTDDLSTILSNQTLTLEFPGHDDNISIPTAYLPISLTDGGRESIFWCSLIALASGGAYIYERLRAHMWAQLSALDKGADAVPKGEKLRHHFNGLKNLNLTGWIYSIGDRDVPMACILSGFATLGVVYGSIASGVQVYTSGSVVRALEKFVSGSGVDGDGDGDAIFGTSVTHGSYALEAWTCQIAPLMSVSVSGDGIPTGATRIVEKSCRDARVARYILLAMLPLGILMFLTAVRPHWFSFNSSGEDASRRDWMAVPLEDNDGSEEDEDDDPMAGFGGNAREQWLLEEE